MSSSPPLPTFVIIGAQKSGTRWLRSNLGRHPEIFTAPAEVHFWNRAHRVADPDGLAWYREKFEGWSNEPIVGEATPGYMIYRHHPDAVATRMKARLPDARVIAILRNPIDRANSAMLHHMRRKRLPPSARLPQVARERRPSTMDRLCLVTGSWYAHSLEGYHREFGDNLLVLLYDDIERDPAGLYAAALRHVGASPGFTPPKLSARVFANPLTTKSKSSAYTLSTAERREMWQYFEEDVAKLEDMLGLDLTRWYPPASDDDDAISGDGVRRLSRWRARRKGGGVSPESAAGS
jgi:hypothetical protein